MVTTKDYADLSGDVYNGSGAPPGWTRVGVFTDVTRGFYGAVYQNADGELVAAIRGTELTDTHDLVSDFNVARGTRPDQFISAENFQQYVQSQFARNKRVGSLYNVMRGVCEAWAIAVKEAFGERPGAILPESRLEK